MARARQIRSLSRPIASATSPTDGGVPLPPSTEIAPAPIGPVKPGSLAVKIATGTPAVPSSIKPELPQAFDDWFKKACAREPSARFANAKELAEAVARRHQIAL